jgi:hypothetical protein
VNRGCPLLDDITDTWGLRGQQGSKEDQYVQPDKTYKFARNNFVWWLSQVSTKATSGCKQNTAQPVSENILLTASVTSCIQKCNEIRKEKALTCDTY